MPTDALGCNSTHLFDSFSLLHYSTGAISNYFGVTLKQAIVLHTIWEIYENSHSSVNKLKQVTDGTLLEY